MSRFTFTNVTSDHTISASFAPRPSGCDPQTIQAESGSLSADCNVAFNYGGYHGAGFVTFPESGGSAELKVGGCAGGKYILTYRYALEAGSATGNLIVNGDRQDLTMTSTGNWASWSEADIPVTLKSGTNNTIRFESSGQGFGILDEITLTPDTNSSFGNSAQAFSSIMIYPNPTNGKLNISGLEGKAHVRILDILGKELVSKQIFSNHSLDISNLKAGVYLIEVRDNDRHCLERLIKE